MESATQQNVLVLLCDQLQKHCLSTYGGQVTAPTFERLAEEGVVFNRYYCATPLCIPTRPSMMNGRWPHAHGAHCFGEGCDTIEKGSELLIDRLHDAGYRVGYDGAWHIRRPPEDDRTCDYVHFREEGFPYAKQGEALEAAGLSADDQRAQIHGLTDDGVKPAQISVPVVVNWSEPKSLEEHPDMQRAQRMAEFILEAPADQPIAAWSSLCAPHPPLMVPEPYLSMYDPDDMEPPPGFGRDLSDSPRSVREAPGALGTEGWAWERWAPAIAAYYGYVAFADHCHGIVLGALEKSGRLDDTIVIYSTDHGEMLGAHGIYQKMVMYERSINIPMVIRAPGIEPGWRNHLTSQTDLAPTILELLAMPPLERAQGRSMAPILREPTTEWREETFSEYNGWKHGGFRMRAVIGHRYKYIYHHEDSDRDELFDLHEDPDEQENILRTTRRPEIPDQLRSRLVGWMRDTDDYIKPYWSGMKH